MPILAYDIRYLSTAIGLDESLDVIHPRRATIEDLQAVHSREHVERMQAVSHDGRGDAGGGFTPMNGESYDLALLSAGSVLTCLERVLSGEADRGYAIARRSGHHASRDTGFGFCVFNNVAVAAKAAQRAGVERIAIVDIDAHHGNGTEAIFYEDPDILTISIHEDRMFPVYAPFCWLALLETLAGAARSADPFAAFLAGAGFVELAPHQRELVDSLVAELRFG